MLHSFENSQIRTQKRVCQNCGKEFTINTISKEDNLDNYPSICLWCKNQSIHQGIKEYAIDLNSKDSEKSK